MLTYRRLAASSIVRLLLCGRPAAIGLVVMAAVVDAIQGMIGGGTRTHVFEKCHKRCAPARADCDASAAVVLEHWRVGIFAALHHAFPRLIFTRLPHAMCGVHARVPFGAVASARLRLPAFQSGALHDFHGAALALATPTRLIAWESQRNAGNCRQSAKSLSGQIDVFGRHAMNSTLLGAF